MAPQHDYILDNQNGAQFRADLNLALEAIATVNSGATAPTTTYAYQYWADTTSGYLKQRDASNADWIVRGKLAADYGQAGQVLTSAGADEPAIWTSITEDGAWTVAEDGTNTNYTFTGNGFDGTETNPTIYVTRGSVYNFTNADTVNGFQIQSVAGLGGAVYTDGTVNNPALAPNTSTVETLVWTVQMDAPSELYYHSTTNAGPGGKIYVLNNIPSSIAATPEIVLEDSLGATAGIEQTAFIRDNDEFKIQTRSATDVVVSTDYNVTLGLSGATSHQWSIDNVEAVRIDSSGRLLVGTSTSVSTLVNAGLQVQSTDANAYASLGRWVNSSANPGLIFNKSRGGSVGTSGIVQSGDNLGEVTFTGDDGSSFVYGARIQAQVDGTPGLNDMPGRLVFSTTADGASTPTERMRIDSSGKVGIGTSSPGTKLEVRGSSTFASSTGSGTVNIVSTDNLVNAGNKIAFFAAGRFDTDEEMAYIKPLIVSNNGGSGNVQDGHLTFGTSGQERLRISFSGNVGIGTSSPAQLLHVNQPTAAQFATLRLSNADGVGLNIAARPTAHTSIVSSEVGDDLYLGTEGTERMRIDSSGNVGIGTSSPIDLLSVGNSTTADQRISLFSNATSDNESYGSILFRFNNANGNKNAKISALRKTNSSGGELVFYTRTPSDAVNDDGGEERMRIDSSGNVGIGTTSPNRNLSISGDNPIIGLTDTDGGDEFFIRNLTGSAIYNVSSAGVHQFNTGGSERVRLDSSGNVGIGTSSPASKLHLADTSTVITFEDTNSTNNSINTIQNYEGTMILHVDPNNNSTQAESLRFSMRGTEAMRIDSSGRLLVGTSSSRTNLVNGTLAAQLQVEGTNHTESSGSFIRNGNDTNNAFLTLGKTRGTANGSNTIVQNGDGLGALAFLGADGTNLIRAAEIQAQVDGTPGLNDMPGRLRFLTTAAGASSPTERMRIDSSGNIGIGTSNPATPLDVQTTGTNAIIKAERTDATTAGDLRIVSGDTTNIIQSAGTGKPLLLSTNSIERMRIDGNGNVGIGVSNPSQTLAVEDDETNPIQVNVRSTQTSASCRLGVGSTGNSIGVWADNTVLEGRTGGLSLGTNNAGSDVTIYTETTRTARLTVKADGIVNIANCPTYADDTAAGTGGLVAGDVYKTSTGELRIKL